MYTWAFFMVLVLLNRALCHPVHSEIEGRNAQGEKAGLRRMLKSLQSPGIVEEDNLFGNFAKIRTRRSSEEECEKHELCRLHAESSHSFIGSFQLYFVSKENARLWDHQAHSAEECARRFPGCGGGAGGGAGGGGGGGGGDERGGGGEAAPETSARRNFRTDYSDEEYY